MCQPQRGEGRGTGGSSPGSTVRVCGMQAGKTASNCLGGPSHRLQSQQVLSHQHPRQELLVGGSGDSKDPKGPETGLRSTNRPLETVTGEPWRCAAWQPSCAGPQGSWPVDRLACSAATCANQPGVHWLAALPNKKALATHLLGDMPLHCAHEGAALQP